MSKNLITNLERIARNTGGTNDALSNQTLSLANTAVVALTVPANARWATIKFESAVPASATDSTRVARYWLDGTTPTATTGIVVAHLDIITVGETKNLNRMKIYSAIGASTTLVAQIQYYK